MVSVAHQILTLLLYWTFHLCTCLLLLFFIIVPTTRALLARLLLICMSTFFVAEVNRSAGRMRTLQHLLVYFLIFILYKIIIIVTLTKRVQL